MKILYSITAITIGLAPIIGVAQEDQFDFSRYQIILEKKPFGDTKAPPPPPPPPPPPKPPAYDWSKDYAITMLFLKDDGSLRLGLYNNKTQDSITLNEGDTDVTDGIKFLRGSYDAKEVVVMKEGVEKTLKVGGSEAKPANTTSPNVAVNPTRSARPSPTRANQVNEAQKNRLKSFAERRAERQRRLAEIRARRAEQAKQAPRLSGDELKQHLREAQMDVIRNGFPPLPVEIDEEMEAQLIEEGVIDP